MEAARQNRVSKQKRMRNRSEILKALSCRNRIRRFKFSRFTPARFGRFGADFLKFNGKGFGALKFHRFKPSRRKFRHLRSGRLKLHEPRLGRLKFHLGLGGVKINPFDFSRAKFDALRLGRAKFDRFRTLGAKILNFIRFEIFSANFAAAAHFKICGVKFCARRSGERSENFIAEFCTQQLKLGLLHSIAKFNRRFKFDKGRAKTSELCPNEFKFNEQICAAKPQRNGFRVAQAHKFKEFQVTQVCKFAGFRVAQAGKFTEFHESKALEFKKFSPQSVRGVQNVQSALCVQSLQTAQSAQHSSRRGENFTSKFRDEIYTKAQPSAKFSAGFHAGKNVELAAKFYKSVAAELR